MSAQGASKEAIQHHYDVSDAFYRLWLDPGCTYSCALWEDGDDLASAQDRKLDFHAHNAGAPGADRVLDIGCGWGSTLRRLVDVHGVAHGTGLTLSATQAAHVATLDRRIAVRLESWEDHVPEAPYDAIISIGAFEHFARTGQTPAERVAGYQRFFDACAGWLVPGGGLSLQTIAYGRDPGGHSAFFESEIFPQSGLPTLAQVAEAAGPAFEVVSVRNDRAHYERTCRAWLANLKAHRAEAEALVGPKVVRRYQDYLKLSIVGFYTGKLTPLRIGMRRWT